MKFDVQPLFIEPVLRVDVSEALTPDVVKTIKNLKMRQNRTNLISEDHYIFDKPELAGLKTAIHGALKIYAEQVMGLPSDQELYVTQSWSLINEPGIGMHGHSHSNSVVSGALYYETMPEPVAGMIFNRHTQYQQLELTPAPDRTNIYNAPLNKIVPKRGEVVMFSSRLQHVIETNMAQTRRYSVSFNSFIRGELGTMRDVNVLELK